jgi:bifunctional non-homologous end joining protein LigD
MRLVVCPEPFDHPDWLFELKYDGWRAIAYIDNGRCRLVSRRRHVYSSFRSLCAELAKLPPCMLDGEIVCLDAEGKPQFYDLRRRSGYAVFVAFDILELNGRDLKRQPLIERKATLRKLIPSGGHILCARHIDTRGIGLFRETCRRDLEGIVAKWKHGEYVTADQQPNDQSA